MHASTENKHAAADRDLQNAGRHATMHAAPRAVPCLGARGGLVRGSLAANLQQLDHRCTADAQETARPSARFTGKSAWMCAVAHGICGDVDTGRTMWTPAIQQREYGQALRITTRYHARISGRRTSRYVPRSLRTLAPPKSWVAHRLCQRVRGMDQFCQIFCVWLALSRL